MISNRDYLSLVAETTAHGIGVPETRAHLGRALMHRGFFVRTRHAQINGRAGWRAARLARLVTGTPIRPVPLTPMIGVVESGSDLIALHEELVMSALHSRVVTHSKPHRRYLSPDVICLNNFDSPPVEQGRSMRGRLPKNVVRLNSAPYLRSGLVCECRLPSGGVYVVLVVDMNPDWAPKGYVSVTAIGAKKFPAKDGEGFVNDVAVHSGFLFRTVIGGDHA